MTRCCRGTSKRPTPNRRDRQNARWGTADAYKRADTLAGAALLKRLFAFDDAAASPGERTARRVMIDWLAADLTAAQLEALPVNLSFYRTAETRAFGSADASASPEDGRRDTPSPDSRILTDLTFNPDDGVFHVEALDWPLPEPDGVGSERAEQTRRAIISYLDYITWGQSTCDAAELARRIDHAARRLHELGLRVIANYDLIASAHDDRSLEQAPFTPDDPDENSPF